MLSGLPNLRISEAEKQFFPCALLKPPVGRWRFAVFPFSEVVFWAFSGCAYCMVLIKFGLMLRLSGESEPVRVRCRFRSEVGLGWVGAGLGSDLGRHE